MILEVDYANEPAIALYQRLGFEQLTARRDYYGPGRHALILKLYDLPAWPQRLAAQECEEAAERQEDAQRPRPVEPPPAGEQSEPEQQEEER